MAIRIPVDIPGRPQIYVDNFNEVGSRLDQDLLHLFRDLLVELEVGNLDARQRAADERLGRLISGAFTDFQDNYSNRSLRSLDILERYAAIRDDIAANRVVDDSRVRQLLEDLRELDQERIDTPESALRQEEPTPENYPELDAAASELEAFILDRYGIREEVERLGGLEPEFTHPLEAESFGQVVRDPTVLFEPQPIGPNVPSRLVRDWRDIDINEIPPTLRTAFENAWKGYTGRMRSLGRDAYVRQLYFYWGVDHGVFRKGSPYLEPIFPGVVGALAERMHSHIIVSPQNPGPDSGGRFETPWGNVEPDFVPARDVDGHPVFGREPEYAQQNNVPSINDAQFVADSKYYGVYRDVRVINFGIFGDPDQIRGMIWLAGETKQKTFVFLGRPNQRVGQNIRDFAAQLGVSVEIISDPRVR